jgi:hypothetical protein
VAARAGPIAAGLGLRNAAAGLSGTGIAGLSGTALARLPDADIVTMGFVIEVRRLTGRAQRRLKRRQ